MGRILIWRSNLEKARERCRLNDDELAVIEDVLSEKETSNIPVDVEFLPLPFVRALLEDAKITPNQRAVLAMRLHGVKSRGLDCDRAYSTLVSNPLEFGSVLLAMNANQPNAEMQWNGRWYPVIVLVEFKESEDKLIKHVLTHVTLGMGHCTYELRWPVDPTMFIDDTGNACQLTVLDVLEKLGFGPMQTSAAEYNLRLVNAERLGAEDGKQLWVKSAVLDLATRFWFGSVLNELPLGTADMPRRAIVEPTLEVTDHDGGYHFGVYRSAFGESVSRLPLVRIFSLDMKKFVFADVDDLEDYEYDETALSRLYLPDDMKNVLQRVFETPAESLFGDLIRGKHGGIVILACGNPGVGKTLTAEVYAEMTNRPLYVLEFGELGTTVDQIERNLQHVFARIVRWRAVLQFDECEIFLAQRGEDLERSAIVGIFLRMLDYYEGLLFLTTNRPEVLDDAIQSRVMLRLNYPDLDAAAQSQIWKTMFDAAELKLMDGTFEDLGKLEVNGRQIRNFTRLAKILHPDSKVTVDQIADLLRFGA